MLLAMVQLTPEEGDEILSIKKRLKKKKKIATFLDNGLAVGAFL